MAAAPLLDRSTELAGLEALVGAAERGEGRVAVIEGVAGIGKSRLLAELRARADGRAQVLSARGSELEREFPFGVVRQLLEAELVDPVRRERALAGGAAPAAEIFAPVSAQPADGASFAALHGLLWLVLNLADERPVVLAVDDLQWCDAPSLRFLAYLARRIEGVAVLLAATLRSSEPGTDPVLLGELASDPATVAVVPGPLGPEAVRALVRELAGEPADERFSEACREATGGNPLLLRQLLSALAADGIAPVAANAALVREIGPRAVSRTVQLRLARLSPDARLVAEAVAVLDGGAGPEAVVALAGLDRGRVAAAARELAQADILGAQTPLEFTHPLVRDAVYHELSPVEREPRHARAATVLRESGAAPEQVATQLLATRPTGEPWAGELLWGVGRAAVRAGESGAAVRHLARALEEPLEPGQRPRLLLELGTAEAVAGASAAPEHLRAAYEELDDPRERAQAATLLGRWLLITGQGDAMDAFVRSAAAEVPVGDLVERLQALAILGAMHGAPGEPLARVAERFSLSESPSVGELMVASMHACVWTYQGRPAAEAIALARRALADGRLLEGDHTATSYGAVSALLFGDAEDTVAVLDRSLALAHRRGSLREAYAAHSWRGVAMLQRGELAGARRVLDAAVESPPGTDGTRMRANAELELLLAEGAHEAVLAAADAFDAQYRGWIRNPVFARWRSLKARALNRLGRAREASELAEQELALARAYGAPGAVAYSLRVAGILGGELEPLEQAVAVSDETPARLEHVKSLFALGRALRLARRPSDAREPLTRALEFAAAHGADGLAAQARGELGAIGVRPRRAGLSGIGSLTPSELRVASLAASGASNRDIAQELYVTPKTVEVHLSSAYRKLDLRSRRELPQALAG